MSNLTVDYKAHSEVSRNFPPSPAYIDLFIGKGTRNPIKLISDKDGVLVDPDANEIGTWWCHSATCVELDLLDQTKIFFQHEEGTNSWTTCDGNSFMAWTKKRERDSLISKTPTRILLSRQKAACQNLSRFRMSMLPVDRLDAVHRDQLQCMGLRVCFHADVGRVLVSSREFRDGEVVIYSKVLSSDVSTDEQVFNIVDPNHPSCCYLLVPRTKKLYYNRNTFSHEDPIASGDLWYLVNHSTRPNTEVLLRKNGIQLRAKRNIQPNEPITWTYPHGFFAKDEVAVDLPQSILPDDVVIPIRE